MTDQSDLLDRIIGMLDGARIPYMVVGSLASSFHGEPRQTRDIDVVIDPEPDALEGQSERQLRDVAAILETQAESLDSEYLHRWIRALGLHDAWERARGLAGHRS